MIIVSLMGGLGNQMFQYAAAKHLSMVNGTDLRIDGSNFRKLTANSDHTFQLPCFNIAARLATRNEIWEVARPDGLLARTAGTLFGWSPHKARSETIYRESIGSGFKPEVLALRGDRYLIGYFNSYRYFGPIRDVLIEEYRPGEAISTEGQALLTSIDSTNSVSLHIRRGDYVDNPEVYKCIEGIITERFYRNAIELIASRIDNPHFFVFSNDMTWVKQNFRIPYQTTYVDFNTAQRGFEDLWLMSRCKHNITAGGSTFSWWAAYLNPNEDKIIVRTERVSNDANYDFPDDYFPPEWLFVGS